MVEIAGMYNGPGLIGLGSETFKELKKRGKSNTIKLQMESCIRAAHIRLCYMC